MTQLRPTNSSPHERAYDRLDPSSAWIVDEYADLPPLTLEPYDWTLEDDAIPFTLIPIPPPATDGSAKLRRSKRKGASSESSILIPVEKIATGKLASADHNPLDITPLEILPIEVTPLEISPLELTHFENAPIQQFLNDQIPPDHNLHIQTPIERRHFENAPLENAVIDLNGALPIFVSENGTSEFAGLDQAIPRPRQKVSSVLLLLLSVVALFVFAYIAQK